MKRILFSAFLVSCLGMMGATSKRVVLCEGFAPKNNLNIPPTLFADSGLTQDQWTTLFDKYEKIYAPIVAARGGTLQLNRLWDDGTVNANADEEDGIWVVNMYGGLARYPGMTVDGMALVVCHETGHHLGGAPKMGGDPTEWAANEGGADTFAVLKCARHMFADEDNLSIVAKMSIDPTIQKTCQVQFQSAQDQAICMRTSAAGVVLGQVLANLGDDSVMPSVNTPDPSVVTATNDSHPAAQCRLDTYFAGASCTADLATFQDNDYHTGSCTAPSSKVGLRPTCWFKPSASDSGATSDSSGGGGTTGGGKSNSFTRN